MPELCGSTSPSISCTAMAASIALPPRSSTSAPARAASGCAATTMAGEVRVGAAAVAGARASGAVPQPATASDRHSSRVPAARRQRAGTAGALAVGEDVERAGVGMAGRLPPAMPEQESQSRCRC